jgi:N-methylhydantoinase B
VTEYALRPDSGGAGRTRGGLGAIRSFEVLESCDLSTQFDRIKFPPPGLHGGGPGAPADLIVERIDGTVEHLPGKTMGVALQVGDKVTILTQGGGGLGPARERSKSAVLADLREGKISEMAALDEYGLTPEEVR